MNMAQLDSVARFLVQRISHVPCVLHWGANRKVSNQAISSQEIQKKVRKPSGFIFCVALFTSVFHKVQTVELWIFCNFFRSKWVPRSSFSRIRKQTKFHNAIWIAIPSPSCTIRKWSPSTVPKNMKFPDLLGSSQASLCQVSCWAKANHTVHVSPYHWVQSEWGRIWSLIDVYDSYEFCPTLRPSCLERSVSWGEKAGDLASPSIKY